MRTICMNDKSLTHLLSALNLATCEIFFCETNEMEMVRRISQDLPETLTPLVDFLTIIGSHFASAIKSYDVMDLGELGIGYAFFLE